MNAITVNGLTKRYQAHTAVDHISFKVQEGEFFAFLGENGAGKSTTINMLCTILAKTAGGATIFGHELGVEDDAIRADIGIVFQNSVLDDQLTVRENLLTRGAWYGFTKRETMERLAPFMDSFGLEEIWRQPYEKLSGGQRRRVDMIRALIHEPKLLFLDEPTTGLDPMSRKMVWDYISRLRRERKMTIFLTTHYMEETNDADRVVILDRGRIAANDTPAGLKSRYTTTKLIWYTGRSEENERILQPLPYSYEADHYVVKLAARGNERFPVTDFLAEYREQIVDYEITKGSMDDVFLTLTGKRMEG
ncbi:multidrug/hemolysin transport system ATP-binding protein [Lachnospiraceae bacterium NK3A20]|jgi:ABC-type multidrug transport system ATPase subunit|nr:multidrug/hemolysin transport system ATP-binding protein [Lachnospiraceae bacterium NK3A20]